MTSHRIFATDKPTASRGPILPMCEHERRAQELTRIRFPKWFKKETEQ